jgi:hypothetical protein
LFHFLFAEATDVAAANTSLEGIWEVITGPLVFFQCRYWACEAAYAPDISAPFMMAHCAREMQALDELRGSVDS